MFLSGNKDPNQHHPRSWFHKAVIYQVFIDRFSGVQTMENRAGFLGGNLRGVTGKIDYLRDLGINVIWLSPFCKTSAYHGYHVTDYMEVDPRFGTLEDLQELIQAAHEREMRVIADLVPNHCSREHPYFRDAVENPGSKYRYWFMFEQWPREYLTFLDYPELPKLNLDNGEVSDYMTGVASYWLSMGLDGFRLDHAIGPSHKFWRSFSRTIERAYPGAALIGEVWAGGLDKRLFRTTGIRHKTLRRLKGISQEKIQFEYASVLHGVLDFALRDILVHAVSRGLDPVSDVGVRQKVASHFRKVPPGFFMVTFLDNHDMNRFIRYCNGRVEPLLRAFELLLSLDQPVVIYTGTENCMPNRIDVSMDNPGSDLQVRAPVDWDHLNEAFINGFRSLANSRGFKSGS